MKYQFREVQKVKKSGGKYKESRVQSATKNYLELAITLTKKVAEFRTIFKASSLRETILLLSLEHFHQMLDKHIDLIERRILKGEKIPHNEKVFSLFEPHTKWINKGKAGVIAELGQKHLIVTDQHHFIVYHELIGDTPDIAFTLEVSQKLKKLFGTRLFSLSFDKGFSSKEIIEQIQPTIANVMIKTKGKPSKARLEIEQEPAFKKRYKTHQAIESNINQLQYHGLDKCRDKGQENFKKYVSLAVVSYNLHRLGNLIKKQLNSRNSKKATKAA